MLDGSPIIFLDNVKDPGNLGTIIRTADWFGLKHIILSEDTVDPYNEKVVRSTMGSFFHVNILESTNSVRLLNSLRQKSYMLVSLDIKGELFDTLQPIAKTVYLFGSESHGIRSELAALIEKRYTIPGKGKAESLNVAVAAGIVMSKL